MAIKLDLEEKKTYDRLEWSFIRGTLNPYKFLSHLVSLIMSYVSTSSVSILVNEGALIQLPLRGIRQKTPYLHTCLLYMEVLRALIEDKCQAKI